MVSKTKTCICSAIKTRQTIKKIEEMLLSAKAVRKRSLKLAESISAMQVKDITAASAYFIAC